MLWAIIVLQAVSLLYMRFLSAERARDLTILWNQQKEIIELLKGK